MNQLWYSSQVPTYIYIYYHYYTNHLYYIIIKTIFKKSRKFRLSSPVLYKIGLFSFGFTLQHSYTATQLYFKHSRVETLLMDRRVSRLLVSAPTMDMWNPDVNSKRGWRSRPWIGVYRYLTKWGRGTSLWVYRPKSYVTWRWVNLWRRRPAIIDNSRPWSLVLSAILGTDREHFVFEKLYLFHCENLNKTKLRQLKMYETNTWIVNHNKDIYEIYLSIMKYIIKTINTNPIYVKWV